MRNRIYILLISLSGLLNNIEGQIFIEGQELDQSWEFREAGKKKWYAAMVPGTNILDLLENELIPDPYYGTNEMDLQWIETRDWEYRKKFKVDKNLLTHDRIELVFKGLDTYSRVVLNGEQLLETDNQHLTYFADVKSLLKEGSNELRVLFFSPVNRDQGRLEALGHYTLPSILEITGPGIERANDKRTAPFARKAQCQYSWDWGPRMVTSGIWRPVELKAWNEGRITDVFYKLDLLAHEYAEYTVSAELNLAVEGKYMIEVYNETDKKVMAVKEFSAEPGTMQVSLPMYLDDPKLWWPHGSGEPFLYRMCTRLFREAELIQELQTCIGVRTIRVERKPDYVEEPYEFSLSGPKPAGGVDKLGSSFTFIVNGVPIYMKGANYVPSDVLLRRSSERIDSLLNMALFANYNMLRIWGGGIYEDESFYQDCSEKGILLWHDFMFACNMYPGDSAFLVSVEEEAYQQVKRLRNYPCIALWSGNNEIQRGWNKWSFQKKHNIFGEDSVKVENDYRKIFHDILPKAVSRLDPDKFYWSSSPQADVNITSSFYRGDMHQFWMQGGEPYEMAGNLVSRFTSETGMQALPDVRTMNAFTPPGERKIFSETLLAHQKRWYGGESNAYDKIDLQLERYFPISTDYEDYIYLSQLSQAKFLKMNIEAHRQRKPYNMGFMYWQFNDTWPGPSWSTVDYYLRPKAGHYVVRDLFAPLLLSIRNSGETLEVFICNDELFSRRARLQLRLMDFSGKLLKERSLIIQTRANQSGIYATLGEDWIPKERTGEMFIHASLSVVEDPASELASSFYYFEHEKDLKLPEPELRLEITESQGEPVYKVSCTKLAKAVFLECKDKNLVFEDNYFDLFPGETREIKLFHKGTEEGLKGEIKLKSLKDLAR